LASRQRLEVGREPELSVSFASSKLAKPLTPEVVTTVRTSPEVEAVRGVVLGEAHSVDSLSEAGRVVGKRRIIRVVMPKVVIFTMLTFSFMAQLRQRLDILTRTVRNDV